MGLRDNHRMLYQIVTMVVQAVVAFVAGSCLLRLYLQWHRIPLASRTGNPLGPLVFAVTDPLVLPLRRVLPHMGRFDVASLTAATAVVLSKHAVLDGLFGGFAAVAYWPWWAVCDVLALSLSLLFGLVLVFVIFSWVQPQSPAADWVSRMVDPLLWPLRRYLPRLAGFDVSPMVLLLLLQVGEIVLQHLKNLVF